MTPDESPFSAYVVDDSEIGADGECKIKTWAAAAQRRERTFVSAPACVVFFVEIGAAVERSRADDARPTNVGPKANWAAAGSDDAILS